MKKPFPIRFVVGPLVVLASLVWLVTSSMKASTLRVMPVEELRALILQAAIYAGVPAANAAFRWVKDVLGDELS